ncbi:hypothetical protein SDC9_156724 [bioreactor metagenome]|uniref:Uncharacterized protein n=1 Tax=bioreactor metagenome TaxID=1076179 RepID=A0A645FA46_9ZZZZ
MGSGKKHSQHVLVGRDGRNRHHPAAQGLAHDDDVGVDSFMLEGKGFSGAAEPGLDLVYRKQEVVLPGDGLQSLEESISRHDHAGLSLDGFHENPDRIFIHCLFHRFEVVVGYDDESRGEGSVIVLCVGIDGEGYDGDRSSVEIVGEDDDLGLVLFNALDHVAPFPHGLDGRFDGFRAGVHGEDHFFPRKRRKLLCEEGPLVVEECPRGEREDVCLVLECFDDLRMPVALVHCRVCREHIHVTASFRVFDPDAFSL